MEDWKALAQALRNDCRGYIHCPECSSDNKALMYGKSNGFIWAKCFRCGFKAYAKADKPSMSDAIARARWFQSVDTCTPGTLPHYCTPDIPAEGRFWLYKASIYGKLIDEYGICWNPQFQRVVLPVRRYGELLGYQARAVMPGHSPKYLTKKFRTDVSFTFRSFEDTAVNAVCLVEDILSAIRVGQVMPCIAALGTNISDPIVSDIVSLGVTKVVSWFDGDGAGDKARSALYKAMSMQGADVTVIQTAKDPKLHAKRDIQRILGEFL